MIPASNILVLLLEALRTSNRFKELNEVASSFEAKARVGFHSSPILLGGAAAR